MGDYIQSQISPELWRNAKAAALIAGKRKISEWIEEAIQEKLDRERQKSKKEGALSLEGS